MRKVIRIGICAMILLISLSSFQAVFATPPPINEKDFTIKVGNVSINLLTMNMPQIAEKTHKKMAYEKPHHEDDILTRVIKTSTAWFYGAEQSRNKVCSIAGFTKRGATARGIRIGSTEKSVLEAYPIMEEDDDDKYIYYGSHAQMPNDEIIERDEEHIDEIRPLYYYTLWFRISKKTKKVVLMSFNEYFWEEP